jgi:hypothetical protein
LIPAPGGLFLRGANVNHSITPMKSLRFSSLLALALALRTACAADAPDASLAPIFNGKDLTGWMQKGGKAKYRIEDGQIIGSSSPGTPNSFLCTERHYTNFILEVEFKVHPALNSGVQIRSHVFDEAKEFEWKGKTIKVPAGRVHGYQCEIDPSKRAWSGGLYEEGRRGWLNNLETNAPARAAFRQNEWNRFRIEATQGALRTWINGVAAADLKDDFTPSGFIGLQVHGVGKKEETMEVRFRNIRLKELP